MGRDSSVGTATRYEVGQSGDRIPAGASFSAPVRNGPGAHPASYTVGTCRGEYRPRQTRQLPRAVDLKGRLLSKLLITTTPFHSLTERYSMNVDGNFNWR